MLEESVTSAHAGGSMGSLPSVRPGDVLQIAWSLVLAFGSGATEANVECRMQDSDSVRCPLFVSVPDLVAHARGHAVAHRFLLFCACDADHELAEKVETQRSSRSRRTLTYSSFSLSEFASGGDGIEVDAEYKPSPNPPESIDSAGLSARGWLLSPGLSRLSRLAPKGRQERAHSESCACAPAVSLSPSMMSEHSFAAAVTLTVGLWTLRRAQCDLIALFAGNHACCACLSRGRVCCLRMEMSISAQKMED